MAPDQDLDRPALVAKLREAEASLGLTLVLKQYGARLIYPEQVQRVSEAIRSALALIEQMPTDTRPEEVLRIGNRIWALRNRGRDVCPEYESGPDGTLHNCQRCHYTADVHLLRDALALIEQQGEERANALNVRDQALCRAQMAEEGERQAAEERDRLQGIVDGITDLFPDSPFSDQLVDCVKNALAWERAERDRLSAQLAEARDSTMHLQKHRDLWRAYAYGRGARPDDFLDGNMIEADRGPTRIETLEAQLAEAKRERDLAIAHDRQPYPTAFAYEQKCEALSVCRRERQNAESALTALRAEVKQLRDEISSARQDAYYATGGESGATLRFPLHVIQQRLDALLTTQEKD